VEDEDWADYGVFFKKKINKDEEILYSACFKEKELFLDILGRE